MLELARHTAFTSGLLLATALLSGCDEPVVKPPSEPGVPVELTDDQISSLSEFGDALASSLSAADPSVFEEAFDYDRFSARLLEGIEIGARDRAEFQEGLLEGVKRNRGGLAAAFLGQDYAFLRVLDRDGVPVLVFRLRLDQGGFNYHAYRFALDPEGGPRLHDFYVYTAGEYVSASMRRTLLPALTQLNRSFLERLSSPELEYLEHLTTIQEIGQHMLARNFDEALRIHDSLPEDVRRDKSLRLTELNLLASTEGGDRYLRAMEAYRESYPSDPSLAIMLLDYHALRGNYDQTMVTIDQIEASVGGDTYLDLVRAAACATVGRSQESVDRARAYIAGHPQDEEGYWTLVGSSLATGDFATVAQGLAELRSRFAYQFTHESLEAEPSYADFLASPEGREFLAER